MSNARRRSFGRRWGIGVGVWLVLVTLGGWLRAGEPASRPADAGDSTIAKSLDALANPDPQVRLSGRAALMRLNRQDLPELRRAVERARPLLPSQAAALQQIVREVYLAGEKYQREPQGFLGILMDLGGAALGQDLVPENENGSRSLGVVVADRIPGFCAARRLLDGDVILGLASPFEPFRQSEDLRRIIGGMKPGVTVRLLVLRRGQVVEVPITLDAHPAETMPDNGELFRAKREERFAAYWQREFEPLVRRSLGWG